jgi:hypothetical protein
MEILMFHKSGKKTNSQAGSDDQKIYDRLARRPLI